jgi:septum formation protein
MALWLPAKPLVLASQSEVRRRILAAAGLPVEVRPAGIDERGIEARSDLRSAAEVARVLAGAKAHTVATHMPGRLVLGADQTLTVGEQRLSKPTSRAAAREQLRALSGQTHRLHSALTLVRDSSLLFEHDDIADLTMRKLSDIFIENYLNAAGDAAQTAVGGYQIESVGIHLFEKISGDYQSILGLPLLPLLEFLRANRFVLE